MNKKTLALVLLTVVMALSFVLVACQTEHKHDYSAEWSYDTTNHWHVCSGCDEVSDKAAHSGGKATCVAKAVCEVCGQAYGELAAHSYGDWAQTKAPTCTEKGEETRTCTVSGCTASEKRDVAVLGHSFAEDWTSDATNHWHACSNCAEIGDSAAHTFGDWTVTKEASYTECGAKERTCSVCNYKEPGTIDQLVAVSSLTISQGSTLTLQKGANQLLSVVYLPQNATLKEVTWSSSNEAIVKVSDKGACQALATGTATITATAKDGQGAKADIAITVVILPESVQLSSGNNVALNGTLNLTATVLPAEASDKDVTWTSSDKSIATVANGVVTGVALGKATITAKTANDKSASVTIWVTETAIDGNLNDVLYENSAAFHADTLKYQDDSATNAIQNETKVVLGEAGLYVTHNVVDSYLLDKTHVADYICVGDKIAVGNTFYFRYYVDETGKGLIKLTYNGKESDSNTFPWDKNNALETLYVVKTVEGGYVVEAFIPYSTLGLTSAPEKINLLTINNFYPTATSNATMAYGNRKGMSQKEAYNFANYIVFDAKGYNPSTIVEIADMELGEDKIVDEKYEATFTITSKFTTYNSCSTVAGLTFDSDYITEVGNGVYKISVPSANQADFASGVAVKVTRGDVELGSFTITLTKTIPVESITITGAQNLLIDGTVTLGVTYNPTNADTYKDITWTSSDESVATVANGVVTAVAEGKVTITAKTANDKTATATIWVTNVTMDGVADAAYSTVDSFVTNGEDSLIKQKDTILFGEKGMYVFADITDANIGTKSHLEGIYTLGDAVADGKTFQIRLYSDGSVKAYKYDSTVQNSNVNWKWVEDKGSLGILNNVLLKAKLTDNGYALEMFVLYSAFGLDSAPEYVMVNPAVLAYKDSTKSATRNTNGLETIKEVDLLSTAKCLKFDQYGYAATLTDPTSVSADASNLDGDSYKVSVTFKATNSKNQTMSGLTFQAEGFDSTWVTEGENGVYNFVIPSSSFSAFESGMTITAINGNHGACGTFTLTLYKAIPVTSVTINGTQGAFVGDTGIKYTATVAPANATNPKITWSSSDVTIATIDADGNITILKAGTVTITATATADNVIGTKTLVIAQVPTEAVVKVTYENGTVVNSGTNSDVVLDTVVLDVTKTATAFNHTDTNTFVEGIDGDANGALQTNNKTGSYLLVKNYNLGTNDFTISTWVYVSSYPVLSGGNGSVIFTNAKVDAKPMAGVWMTLRRNNSDASKATGAYIAHKATGDTGTQINNKTSLSVIGWHKYTMTRQGTKLCVYVDGDLIQTRTLAEGADLGSTDLCFGAYLGESWEYQNGNIAYDNISIYNYALTQDQIAVLVANKK